MAPRKPLKIAHNQSKWHRQFYLALHHFLQRRPLLSPFAFLPSLLLIVQKLTKA
jgi:hypothetical protein